MTDPLTPQNMRFPNDAIPPEGLIAEPRTLSSEVAQLKHEVTAMREAILRLIDVLQNNPIPKEVV